MDTIPSSGMPVVKLCECGCGLPVPPSTKERHERGLSKGQPQRYLYGHKGKIRDSLPPPNPSGLCMCGCGQPTLIAKGTDRSQHAVKGLPQRYIHGHARAPKKEPLTPVLIPCACGCGEIPSVAAYTNAALGMIRGQTMRFVSGHNTRTWHESPEVRFWKNVNKTDSCWLWTGTPARNGYGHLHVNGKEEGAHRFSWMLVHGPIPKGLHVCHNCPGGDNPLCVNPDHMFLGTPQEHVKDRVAKGQMLKGDAHPMRIKMKARQMVP